MESIEKLTWQYIDGTITSSDKLKLENRLAADPICKQTYDDIVDLNKRLKTIEVEKAPAIIMSGVMDSIKDYKKPVVIKHDFKGFTYIVSGMTMISILCFIVIYFDSNPIAAPRINYNLDLSGITLLETVSMPQVHEYMTFIPSYYSIIISCLLIMFWMDQLLNKVKVVQSRS